MAFNLWTTLSLSRVCRNNLWKCCLLLLVVGAMFLVALNFKASLPATSKAVLEQQANLYAARQACSASPTLTFTILRCAENDLPWAVSCSALVDGGRLTYEGLPKHLRKLGQELFGSEDFTKELLQKADAVQLVCSTGVPLLLVAHAGDDTLGRLSSEMKTDRYSVRSVQDSSKEQNVIIDIGSNIGDVSILASKLHPRSKVLTFEPVPTTFFWLRLNLWLNSVLELDEEHIHVGLEHPGGVLALHSALTLGGGQVEVKYTNSKSQNAAVGTDSELTADWSSDMVRSVVLPDFLQHHRIEKVALFKIDCEGCEFEVIPQMHAWLKDKKRVRRIVGEIHQSLAESKGRTHARKASPESVQAMNDVLRARGCAVGSWTIDC